MFEILNTTSTLFVTIFLGGICGLIGLFKPGQDRILINYVFYVALPLNLFLSCYKHANLEIFQLPYLASYFISTVFIITITYILSIKNRLSSASGIVNTLSTTQIDGAYFTIPLFEVVFHSPSSALPLMFIQNVVFFTLTLIWLQLSIENKSEDHSYLKFFMSRAFHVFSKNPIILSSVLGLACGFLQLPITKTLEYNVKFIGSTSSAVALFSLGLTCAFHLKSLSDKRQIIQLTVLSLLKLLIFPAFAFAIGIFCFHLPHNLLLALVLLTASPAATHNYIIANKYNCDTETATFNVVITTILSFFTINLWLYLIQ